MQKAGHSMQRLFVYGSLKPGGVNEHILLPFGGHWEKASLRGQCFAPGWRRGLDFPGLVLDQRGDDVAGYVFRAAGLESYWPVLDRFEGEAYERVAAEARLSSGASVSVQVYVIRTGRPAS